MPQTFAIEEIDQKKISIIQELTLKVWPQTYGSIITREQIDFMLEMMYSTESLLNQMQSGHQFLLLTVNQEPLGFASYGANNNSEEYKLHKLYLLPKKQHQGYGKALLLRVIDDVKKSGGKHLILQVNRNNQKAIAFYERNGFKIERSADFEIGNGFLMNDYIMGIYP